MLPGFDRFHDSGAGRLMDRERKRFIAVVADMADAAEFMPFMVAEDAFICGVVARLVGVGLVFPPFRFSLVSQHQAPFLFSTRSFKTYGLARTFRFGRFPLGVTRGSYLNFNLTSP